MTQHLITTKVRTATCHCGAPVLHGHEEGYWATVDATPIPAAAELAILLVGAHTYTLLSTRELVLRTDWRIKSTMLQGTIHAEHYCTRIRRQKAEARNRTKQQTRTEMQTAREIGKQIGHASRLTATEER